VQRFHRDVDETKDWIQEKDEALDSEDFGRDLRSVQALQRKHEGVERDLAALGDKIKTLDEKANKLRQTHPEAAEQIFDLQRQLTEQWIKWGHRYFLLHIYFLNKFIFGEIQIFEGIFKVIFPKQKKN
jgi:spermidine/putrescine-binding protein